MCRLCCPAAQCKRGPWKSTQPLCERDSFANFRTLLWGTGRCYLIYFPFFSVFQVGATLYSVHPVGTISVLSHSSIPKWQCLPGRIFYTRLVHQFVCLVTCFFFGCHSGNSPWSPGSGGQGDCVYWVLRGRTCQCLAYNKPESRCWLRPSTMGN